ARVYETRDQDVSTTWPLPPVSLDLFGWAQPRFTYQQSDERPEVKFLTNPAFSVYHARLGAIGQLGEVARAQFEIELAREVAQPLDAFVVLTPITRPMVTLNLTLGQFRVPFSRQNQLRNKNYQLADPAYWVSPKFVIDRDLGAMIDENLFDG